MTATLSDKYEQHERRESAEKAAGFVLDRLFLRTRIALAEPKGKKKAAAREMLEQMAKRAGKREALSLFLAEGFQWRRRPSSGVPEARTPRRPEKLARAGAPSAHSFRRQALRASRQFCGGFAIADLFPAVAALAAGWLPASSGRRCQSRARVSGGAGANARIGCRAR